MKELEKLPQARIAKLDLTKHQLLKSWWAAFKAARGTRKLRRLRLKLDLCTARWRAMQKHPGHLTAGTHRRGFGNVERALIRYNDEARHQGKSLMTMKGWGRWYNE